MFAHDYEYSLKGCLEVLSVGSDLVVYLTQGIPQSRSQDLYGGCAFVKQSKKAGMRDRGRVKREKAKLNVKCVIPLTIAVVTSAPFHGIFWVL